MSLKAFITITRPANPIFGSLSVISAMLTSHRFILSNGIPRWTLPELGLVLLMTSLTYICLAAAGNVVNDIYDLEVDRVNRPERPLPSGAMTMRQAKIWTAILAIIGLFFSVLTIPFSAIGLWTPVIAIIFGVVALAYAAKGKVMGLLGNFAVAISFAFGIFYGAFVTSLLVPPIIWVFFITAASVLQGREAIKGIEDIEGDALRDVQTIARKYGVRIAAYVAAVFNLIGIIGFITPWIANWLGWNWIGPFYVLLLIPGSACVAASSLLVLRNPIKNASRASLLDKLGAFQGLINFVLGAF